MKKKRWHKVDVIVDRLIPYCLVILIIIISIELANPDFAHHYHLWFTIADTTIIGIFVVDLIFKYNRVKDVPLFLKKYWLEIIAIFPAFLVVRVVEEFVLIANLDQTLMLSQEALEVGERTGSRASRIHYFGRFIRPLARIPRFFKAFHFYDRPEDRFN